MRPLAKTAAVASTLGHENLPDLMNWQTYFLRMADTTRLKSKDPNTQVGAIIVGPEKQILSTGFNGFPRGINDDIPARWERPIKYEWIEHAERNAIYNAARHGIALRGASMYIFGFGPPCSGCARAIIQAGITKVVFSGRSDWQHQWAVSLEISREMLSEAGVIVEEAEG